MEEGDSFKGMTETANQDGMMRLSQTQFFLLIDVYVLLGRPAYKATTRPQAHRSSLKSMPASLVFTS